MSTKLERAKFGAQAHKDEVGKLPTPFPRSIGPNAASYLQEVIDSGLLADMTTRFEQAFAAALGVKHFIATPGCTPALAVLAASWPWEAGDEILAEGVVPVQFEGELALGADAVGAGNQYRFAVLFRNLEQRAEAADAGEHLGAHGAAGVGLDALDEAVAGIDVDAGVTVGERVRGRCAQVEFLGRHG